MSKLKTYAVTVEVTTEVVVFVDARSPRRAEEIAQTDEGWAGATRYGYGDDTPHRFNPRNMSVVKVRPV